MAASKRLPYRSCCCLVSSPFDIGFLGKVPLFEGRLQRPWPFLVRSLPGRDRVTRGLRDTRYNWRRFCDDSGLWIPWQMFIRGLVNAGRANRLYSRK